MEDYSWKTVWGRFGSPMGTRTAANICKMRFGTNIKKTNSIFKVIKICYIPSQFSQKCVYAASTLFTSLKPKY